MKYISGHQSRGRISANKGKTWEDMFGTEGAKRMHEALIQHKMGKTYEQQYGIEKATLIKAHMSQMRKGRVGTWTGKTFSISHRHNISRALTGRPCSEKTKKKIGDAQRGDKGSMYGKKLPEWHKQRMMEGHRNKIKGKTLEERLGKKRADEIKQKFSKIHKGQKGYWNGKKFSLEHCDKIRADRLGKSYEERHGPIMAAELKKLQSEWIKNNRIGEKNPNWLGGKSFEPYTLDFNKQFKEAIRIRDNYTCQLCSIFEDDHLQLHSRRLAIHHTDYDKKNTFPQNCITLCMRCNILVNKDREIWTKHFQDLLKKLYGYEYTQDQKIILDFTGGNNG